VLPYFIPEEAEKLVNQTPLWKIKLVKDSLKYMMTDEDEGWVDSDWSDKGLSPTKIKKVYRNKKTKETSLPIEVYNSHEPVNLEAEEINDSSIQ